jgi:hypothetical protein
MPYPDSNGDGHRRVLVVATAPVRPRDLRAQLADLGVDAASEVKVVSPASNLSWLQWLANEEDAARADAEAIAEETAGVAEEAAETRAEVGDVDPIQAAEDALAEFPADELIVVVPPEDDRSQVERAALDDGFERFGVPVRYLAAGRRRNGE